MRRRTCKRRLLLLLNSDWFSKFSKYFLRVSKKYIIFISSKSWTTNHSQGKHRPRNKIFSYKIWCTPKFPFHSCRIKFIFSNKKILASTFHIQIFTFFIFYQISLYIIMTHNLWVIFSNSSAWAAKSKSQKRENWKKWLRPGTAALTIKLLTVTPPPQVPHAARADAVDDVLRAQENWKRRRRANAKILPARPGLSRNSIQNRKIRATKFKNGFRQIALVR